MKKILFSFLAFFVLFAAYATQRAFVSVSSSAQMQGGNGYPVYLGGPNYSVQASWTGASLAGYFIVSSSNDKSNWFQVASTRVSGTGSYFLNTAAAGYPWASLSYTPTSTNAWTVAPIADIGVAQVSSVTAVGDNGVAQIASVQTVADVSGSLTNKWFKLFSINATSKSQKNYYVWYDDGNGVDPAVPGYASVHVSYTDGYTAASLATVTASAIASLTNDFSSATAAASVVTITDAKVGSVAGPSDGTAKTGFLFGVNTAGVNSNLNNTYFTISAVDSVTKGEKDFYVWYNVNSLGTDPVLAGKTASVVAVPVGYTAASVATATASVLASLTNDFASSTASAASITVTNAKVGLVPSVADGAVPTKFIFQTPVAGVNSLNNDYFVFYSANNAACYYAWLNVDSLGTDPLLAGCAAASMSITHGFSAASIGTVIAASIASLNSNGDFTTSGTSTVTVTNKAAGPSTFPVDHGTGFTFAGTVGAGTLTSSVSY